MICLSDKATLIGEDRYDFVRRIYMLVRYFDKIKNQHI
jgi:hypothetical protein